MRIGNEVWKGEPATELRKSIGDDPRKGIGEEARKGIQTRLTRALGKLRCRAWNKEALTAKCDYGVRDTAG
jgi:hypothetical protein